MNRKTVAPRDRVVGTRKVIVQVREGRRTYYPVLVTAYIYADGKTRIPHKSYNAIVKDVPRGHCVCVF